MPLLAWGDKGDQPGGFGAMETGFSSQTFGPIGICIVKQGYIRVSAAGGRIQQFTACGRFLRGFGDQPGSLPCEFMAPHGIAIDRHGHLFVVDSYNHRIQKFDVAF